MSRLACRRRAARLRPIICRTLRREYRLYSPTEEIRASISFVEASPDLPDAVLEPAEIFIGMRDGFLVARTPTGNLIEGTSSHLISAMHRRIFNDLVDGDPGAPFIHGATVVIGGKRLLLVGRKGCGKSTLALYLALAGHKVEGDEHLLIRANEVVARPRTLRIKEGSLALLAHAPPAIWEAPSIHNWDGSVIRSISPAVCGHPWVIRAGELDAMIFLSANHGGKSVARPVTRADALRHLMDELMLPNVGVAVAAGRIQRLSLDVPSYKLSLGELDMAEWHLRQIADMLT